MSVRNENEVALQRAEMRMVRWMYGIKLQDRVTSKGLRERLGLLHYYYNCFTALLDFVRDYPGELVPER